MNADGSIRIKTEIDNSKVEDGMKEFKKLIQEGATEGVVTDEQLLKAEEISNKFEEAARKQEQLTIKAKEYEEQLYAIEAAMEKVRKDPIANSGGEFGSATANQNVIELQKLNDEALKFQDKIDDANSKSQLLSIQMRKAENNAEKLTKQLFNSDIEGKKLNESVKKASDNLKNSGNHAKSIGDNVNGGIRKIARYAMALLSVRTIYGLLTKAANSWMNSTEEGKQAAADIQGIWNSLGQSLAPVITWLINLLKTMLGYLNAITQAFFGFTLFSKTTATNMNKSAGAAREIRKQLAGFDEMNVLNDSGGESGVGIESSATPDMSFMDTSKFQDGVDKIKKLLKDLEPILKGLVAGMATFLLMKGATKAIGLIGKLASGFKKIDGESQKGFQSVELGMALMVGGAVTLIDSVFKLINGWDEMSAKERTVTIAFAAIGAAAIALGYAIATGLTAATLGIGALIAIAATAVTAVVALVAKWATEEDQILSTKDALEQLKQAQDDYTNANNDYVNAIDKAEEAFRKLEEAQNRTNISGQDLYDKVQEGTLDYKDMTDAQKEVYKAYLDNDNAQKQVKSSTEALSEAKRKETSASFANKLAIAAETGNYDEYKNTVIEAFEKGEISASEARDLIEKSMSRMSDSARDAFVKDIPASIKDGLEPSRYQTMGNKLSSWFSNLWEGMKSTARNVWNTVSGWFSGGSGTSSYSSSIPVGGRTFSMQEPQKMARGGIVNRATTLISGEAGKEAIIPLENNKQGIREIAELISTLMPDSSGGGDIIINLDGNVIARVVNKVNKDSAFRRNGVVSYV